jgi:hypothetical protein
MRRYTAALVAFALISTIRLGASPSSSLAVGFTAQGPKHEAESPAREAAVLGQMETLAHRMGLGNVADMRAALKARARIAASTAVQPADVKAGIDNKWTPLGRGPLLANVPEYPSVYGEGFAHLAGRVADFAYDATHNRLYAAVAQGGLWESSDLGKSWHSIGEAIPTQLMGSVGYTTAGGGTLIALTGDNAFGGDTYPGMGAYWSTDRGATWHKALGAPDGALGFKVAVDPTNPNIVYLATGLGLYRSVNAGVSFINVDLPTGACHGNSYAKNCFLANVVTDVVVQGKDNFGNAGGAVLAAIGWRAGAFKNFDGAPQAPYNGLYRSATGARGSFTRLDVDNNGFAPQVNIGRVEMGGTTGPDQNSGYVYALVQDAILFTEPALLGIEGVPPEPLLGLGASTILNGIYSSSDFGLTWKKMASGTELQLPGNGSSLSGALAADGYGPGIQSWYDQWIRPDPTRQLNGVPTRLVFGLEETWENELPLPQDGISVFHAIGPYQANSAACIVLLVSDLCAPVQSLRPDRTTTHPDHHSGIFIPDGQGGVTLFDGNDGGVASQHVSSLGSFSQEAWGLGANNGFHTLLPYGVAIGSDGSVYAGLQDNGELKIEPDGRQVMVFGGDGTMTLVDPRNPNVVYEALPQAGINVSQDAGHTWADMDPFLTQAGFIAPMVMDPLNPDHIVTAGREIAETVVGPNTPSGNIVFESDWTFSWDLGTKEHRGDANATSTETDPDNETSALAVRGNAIYAAFCGSCDPVKAHKTFASGFATNVGGAAPPKSLTADGWHITKAKGLPQGNVTAIQIDPLDVRTIYVTVGGGVRPFVPAGKLGKDGITQNSGSVFVSKDAGETFTDITGNLHGIPGLWVMLHGRQLVVATTVGVFVSRDTNGKAFNLLGADLPPAPVYSLAISPHDPDLLVAASFGRGVYAYHFGKAAVVKGIKIPLAKPLPKPHLPATGVGSRSGVGILILLLAAVVTAWMWRRRVGRETA